MTESVCSLAEHRVVVLPEVDEAGTLRPGKSFSHHLERSGRAAGEDHLVFRYMTAGGTERCRLRHQMGKGAA